ncbi:MAG: transcriptional repressor LexA [Firmicutes bacterium]|nr:transcriptional repressor LexA [Bacillota bacterium]
MRIRNKEKYNEIIEAINDLFFDSGQIPSIREIGDAVRMPIGSLMRYLGWLREDGLIEYDDGKYRGITTDIIRKAKCGHKPIPIVGTIACGTPALAEENIDSYISISTEFLGRGQYFFLRASGESMIEAGIDDGDLVLIKQQEHAWDGQIVVALTEDGETTLKRFYRDDKLKMIRLRPENSEMEDVLVRECQIQGIAIKVIKDL